MSQGLVFGDKDGNNQSSVPRRRPVGILNDRQALDQKATIRDSGNDIGVIALENESK